MNKKLDIIMGDLFDQDVEAIVNPTSATLLEGGEVDATIRKLGGPELEDECKNLHGCPVGAAKSTSAPNMKFRVIIHTTSPIWRGGYFGEDKLLQSSYKSSLQKAMDIGIKTIAFPSLSTGSHRFPVEKAALIAIKSISEFLEENPEAFDKVSLVFIKSDIYELYKRAFFNYINN